MNKITKCFKHILSFRTDKHYANSVDLDHTTTGSGCALFALPFMSFLGIFNSKTNLFTFQGDYSKQQVLCPNL